MKIAVIGAGNIGGTIGRKWAQAGHEIIFGVRKAGSPKVRALLEGIDGSAIAAPTDAAIQAAELVLFAIPHAAVAQVVQHNTTGLHSKLIIDASNNFAGPVINNIGVIADAAPHSRIFRAFNSLGWEVFANPQFEGIPADHFYCGPDGDSHAIVETLIRQVGVNPVYVGGLESAPLVDALGSLWVTLVFQRGMPRHLAFKMLLD